MAAGEGAAGGTGGCGAAGGRGATDLYAEGGGFGGGGTGGRRAEGLGEGGKEGANDQPIRERILLPQALGGLVHASTGNADVAGLERLSPAPL
jgi:hypothetical protein